MFDELKQMMLKVARTAYSRGHVSGSQGDLSVRTPDGRGILITASGVQFWEMEASDILFLDWDRGTYDAETLAPTARRPSAEARYHLDLCRDTMITSVMKSCSPSAAAWSLGGARELPLSLHDARRDLRSVPVIDPPSSSADLAEAVVRHLSVRGARPDAGVSAIIIRGIGIVAAGRGAADAYRVIDTVEHCCATLCRVPDDLSPTLAAHAVALADGLAAAASAIETVRREVEIVRKYVYEEFRNPGYIHGRLSEMMRDHDK